MFISLFTVAPAVIAQDSSDVANADEVNEVKGALDGVKETILELKTTLDALKKIKVSGYIQSQYQAAEAEGISSFAGGNFPTGVRDRFQVRRGRLKVNYDNDLTQYVLQIDVTQNGVGVKDAYVSIKEPWIRTFALTSGIFDRPFGFEISYSSSNRETPERSRLFQTLFPGERELGVKIEAVPENGLLSNFNLKAGLFNGVLNTANENDRTKDFIGRIGFQFPMEEQNLSFDGGLSLYDGKVTNNSKFVHWTNPASRTYTVDSTTSNIGGNFGRMYYGADLQLYYDLPLTGGMSLRGEYIAGQQPGTATSSSFYTPGNAATPLYLRKFSGWYIFYLQNIGLSHQFAIKYDVYDPNTEVEASDIGAGGSNLSAADIKYSTLGLGWIYHWDTNVKFTFFYDYVMNERINPTTTGALLPFTDNVHDNVFTTRVQFKF